jgi:hypothetical protein
MPVIKDVVIAMPAYDNKTEFDIYRAIYDCINDPENPVSGMINYNGDSLVTRARNECVLQFEQMPVEKAKYLIFIDSDIHFQPHHVTALRAHNKQVIAGLYFLKNMHCAPVLNTPHGEPEGKLQKVKEAGTGFLMIRRDVFAGLRAMGIAKTYRPGGNQHLLDQRRTEFFPVGIQNDYLLSEDYYFCWMCEQLGIPVYVDTSVVVGHKGWAMYPFKPDTLAKALPAAMRSFKDLPNEQKVTPEMMQQIIDAYGVHAERNGIVQNISQPELPKELDFEVTYPAFSTPETTTPANTPDARGGA